MLFAKFYCFSSIFRVCESNSSVKRGVRERFAKVNTTFCKEWRFRKKEFRSTTIYVVYVYIYIYIYIEQDKGATCPICGSQAFSATGCTSSNVASIYFTDLSHLHAAV